jgi:hypothetical protein
MDPAAYAPNKSRQAGQTNEEPRRSPRSSERIARDVSKTADIEEGEMNGNVVW